MHEVGVIGIWNQKLPNMFQNKAAKNISWKWQFKDNTTYGKIKIFKWITQHTFFRFCRHIVLYLYIIHVSTQFLCYWVFFLNYSFINQFVYSLIIVLADIFFPIPQFHIFPKKCFKTNFTFPWLKNMTCGNTWKMDGNTWKTGGKTLFTKTGNWNAWHAQQTKLFDHGIQHQVAFYDI